MPNMVNKERAEFIKGIQDEKAEYERELRADPKDPAAKENLKRVNSILRRFGVTVGETKKSDGAPFDTPKPYKPDEKKDSLKNALKKKPKPNRLDEQPEDLKALLMKDGGMARGRGGKMYQHNYATGGSVTDHLSKVVGPPQSVQSMTATVETPAERSKRLRMGG